MLVALINPPWLQDGRVGIRAGSRWSYTVESLGHDATIPFPFFLAQTASLLESHGFDITLMDGVAEKAELDPYLDRVVQADPQLIVYETSTPSFRYDCDIAGRLRDRLPTARIAFAGPHVTVFPAETLREQQAIDFILVGEYEATALALAEALREGRPPDGLPGLCLRSGDQIQANERRSLIEDLDALPLPRRDAESVYGYHESLCARRPNAQLMTSRGCVFRCPFCLWPKVMYGGQNLRVRSAESVVDEIQTLERDFNFAEYYFDDDAINLKEGHVESICDELRRRGMDIVWSCMAHTGRTSQAQLARMQQAGCESIKWGVETGDAETLAQLKKGTTLEQIREAFRACRSLGLRTHATFTIGLPGETRESMQRTRDFMLELEPDSTQISIATPFPGTDMFDPDAAEEWDRFDGAAHAVATPGGLSVEELEQNLAELQRYWEEFRRKREGFLRRAWRSFRRGCRPSVLLLLLGAAFAMGCGKPTVDASSRESMRASIEEMRRSLSSDERRELDETIETILTGKLDLEAFYLGYDTSDLSPDVRKAVDGKNVDELFAEAKAIREKRKAEERERVEAEIKEIDHKRAADRAARVHLAKFEVSGCRYYRKDGFGDGEAIIEFSVHNRTRFHVARAYFRATLSTPERPTPWLKHNFNYEIPGGVSPGEQVTWSLIPSGFSTWGRTQVPNEATLTIEILRLDGLDGREIFSAMHFTEADEALLADLRAKLADRKQNAGDSR